MFDLPLTTGTGTGTSSAQLRDACPADDDDDTCHELTAEATPQSRSLHAFPTAPRPNVLSSERPRRVRLPRGCSRRAKRGRQSKRGRTQTTTAADRPFRRVVRSAAVRARCPLRPPKKGREDAPVTGMIFPYWAISDARPPMGRMRPGRMMGHVARRHGWGTFERANERGYGRSGMEHSGMEADDDDITRCALLSICGSGIGSAGPMPDAIDFYPLPRRHVRIHQGGFCTAAWSLTL